MKYKLVSYKTKKEINEKDSATTDDLGGPLEVVYDFKRLKKRFNSYIFETTPISSLKYLDLYPINDYSNIISLNEGGTPLYESTRLKLDLNLKNLYFKYEGSNPTGSFKDRGTVIEVAKAIELKAKAITLASTGNMAASVACYSKKAQIPCYVFVPEGTPPSKLAQSLAFGAHVIQVRGKYVEAAKLAEEVAKKYNFYLAGDYCFRQEGQKSIAYEIIEQLRWQVPDYVIIPVGVGTNISAIWKGFNEYKKLGLIKKLPKIIAVQAEGASPVIKTFNLNLKEFYIEKSVNTLSGAIAVGNPLDGIKVIDLLKDSKGYAVSVDDNKTLEAQLELANKESIFVEPSSATVVAALRKLFKDKIFKKEDIVVCVLTGNGLKDPEKALKLLSAPALIDVSVKAFDDYFTNNKEGLIVKNEDLNEVVFTNVPSVAEIKKVLRDKFNIEENINLSIFEDHIDGFIKKGKGVTISDLKYIYNVAARSIVAGNFISIEDFEIYSKKDAMPEAKLLLNIDGQQIESKSNGTGPVDAAIKAIFKALEKTGRKKVNLVDYKVEINSSGTDSVVEVFIILRNDAGKEITSIGTSPDIIQASIESFVNGVNELIS